MSAKVVAIVQSNYIPWKGYFDLMRRSDEFVILDNVQYTRRDWRNRNRIKGPNGLHWLTIPVDVKGKYHAKICDVSIADENWAHDHWRTIQQFYRRAEYFERLSPVMQGWYEQAAGLTSLSNINLLFLKGVCQILKIHTAIRSASEFPEVDDPNRRLLEICHQCHATTYLSGPAAKSYLDVELFESQGIHVAWMEYAGYREYPQLHGPFDHSVSVLDLLLSVGSDAATEYLLTQSQTPLSGRQPDSGEL